MGLRQIIGVFQRVGLQIIRSKWTIPYLILFPAFFIGVYWFGFSASEVGTNQTFQLGAINHDAGLSEDVKTLLSNETIMQGSFSEWHSSEVLKQGFASELITLLNTTKYSEEPDAKRIFDVTLVTNINAGQESLETRKLDILIEFSPTFSNATLSLLNQYWKQTNGVYLHELIQQQFPEAPDLPTRYNETLVIRGDETYINYQLANSILTLIMEEYFDLTSAFDSPGGTVHLVFNEEYLISIPKYSVFEMIVPGLIAFGIVIQPSLFAFFLGDEFHPEHRTFDRLHIAALSPTSYVLGTLLIQIPITIVQTAILFAMSLMLGFSPQGDIFLAFGIALTILPFNAALSYLTAAFFHDEMTIGTVLGFGAPLLGFASGAFTSLPHLVLFPDFFPTPSGMTRDFLFWDLLPLTHAVNAMRDVLLYNFAFNQVFYDIMANLVLSMVLLIISIVLFTKYRFHKF